MNIHRKDARPKPALPEIPVSQSQNQSHGHWCVPDVLCDEAEMAEGVITQSLLAALKHALTLEGAKVEGREV